MIKSTFIFLCFSNKLIGLSKTIKLLIEIVYQILIIKWLYNLKSLIYS